MNPAPYWEESSPNYRPVSEWARDATVDAVRTQGVFNKRRAEAKWRRHRNRLAWATTVALITFCALAAWATWPA